MANTIDITEFATTVVSDIEDVINKEVRLVAWEALKRAVSETIYSRPTYEYQRSGQLKEAVRAEVEHIGDGKAEFSIYIDTGKLKPQYRNNNWHSYASYYDFTNTFNDFNVVKVLDEGTKSPFALYKHPPAKFHERGLEIMDREIIYTMANALMAKGYDVTIL